MNIQSGINVDSLSQNINRFFGDKQNFYVIGDSRRIEARTIRDYSRDINNAYVLHRAIAEGFSNSRWESITSLKIDGEVFEFPEAIQSIEIDGMQSPIEGLQIVRDDDGKLIAERMGDCILLPMGIDRLSPRLFVKMLVKMGYAQMTDAEYFTKLLTRYAMAGMSGSIEDSRNRMSQAQNTMQSMFAEFISHKKTYETYKRQVEGIEKYDTAKGMNILEQVNRLLKSKYMESLQIEPNGLYMLTKPLKMSLWNIGQYSIYYKIDTVMPVISRVTLAADNNRIMAHGGTSDAKVENNAGCHISDGRPCSGNYSEMLKAFWMQDMLTGFNSTIKFIKSYSKPSGPYIDFENLLMSFGYYSDAKKLYDAGCVKECDNGIIYMFNIHPEQPMTVDELKGLGLTGKIDKPDNIEKFLVESKRGTELHMTYSIEYVDLTGGEERGE